MKKNFIIFGIILLFAVSLVFAGITSYVLKEGESLGKAKIDAVLKDKVVIGEKVYSKGDVFREDGKAYRVKEIKPKSWFLGSDKVEIEEVDESEVPETEQSIGDEFVPNLNRSFLNKTKESFAGKVFEMPVLFSQGLTSSQINSLGELNTMRIYLRNLLTIGSKNVSYNIGVGKNNALFFYGGSGQEGNFFFSGDLITSGNLKSNDLTVDDEITAGNLQLTDEGGEGNAYACFSSSGILFRSNTPCK